MTKQTVDLITVHGTFAGDDADDGAKWWQRGSEFLTRLQSCIEEPLRVRPFHWSGRNSETDRRRAAAKLSNAIAAADRPIVVGHSHGGSVGIHALALLVMRRRKQAADAIRAFVTIGTPMILFRSNRNIFTRYNLYGRILLLLTIGIGAVYSVDALATIFDPKQFRQPFPLNVLGHLKFFFGAPQPWIALGAVGLLYWYGRRNALRQNIFRRGSLTDVFAGKFEALSHSQDEAIRALSRARDLNPKVVRFRTIFGGLFSLFAFGLVFLELGSQMSGALISDRHFYGEEREIGPALPRMFSVAAPDAPLLPRRVSQRQSALYDALLGARYELTTPMMAVAWKDLWENVSVRSIVEAPGGEWLADFAPRPGEEWWVFFPSTGGPISERIDEASDHLAAHLQGLADRQREIGYAFHERFESGEEEGFRPEDVADPYYLFAADGTLLEWRLRDWIVYRGDIDDAAVRDDGQFSGGVGLSQGGSYVMRREDARDGVFCGIGASPRETGALDYRTDPACRNFWQRFGPVYRYGLNLSVFKWDALLSLNGDFSFPEVDECTDWRVLEARERTSGGAGVIVERPLGWRVFEALERASGRASICSRGFSERIRFVDRSIVGTAFILVVALGASAVAAAVLAMLLTPVFQGILTGTLKSTAYGNDGFGEQVSDVRPSLDFADGRIGTIPPDVEAEMIANSEADAPAAIMRLRTLLAEANLSSLGGADPLSTAMQFERSELIHNAYFQSEKLVIHLAAALIVRHGLTASAAFLDDPDARAALAALQ